MSDAAVPSVDDCLLCPELPKHSDDQRLRKTSLPLVAVAPTHSIDEDTNDNGEVKRMKSADITETKQDIEPSTQIVSSEKATVLKDVNSKRTDCICWDDYFMSVAFLSAMRSKDPSTQVGACIVSNDKRIVGIGYNGFPRGCSDDKLPWARVAEDALDTKYPVGNPKLV